jgi:hypothetical protein
MDSIVSYLYLEENGVQGLTKFFRELIRFLHWQLNLKAQL